MTDDNKKEDEKAEKKEEVKIDTTEDKKVEEKPKDDTKSEEKPTEGGKPKEDAKPKEEEKPSAKPKSKPRSEPKPTKESRPKEDKPSVKLTGKLEKLAKELESLTVLEMSELASYLEEKLGVSAMPAAATVAPRGGGVGADAETAPTEEKSTYDVVLSGTGDNKLAAIKALREFRQDLGLMDAKKMVESAPQTVLEQAKKEDAESAKKKLEEAGAKVELK